MTITNTAKHDLEFTQPDEALHPNLTDMGNAERFKQQYGTIIHYSYERKRWLCWARTHWEWDGTGRVESLAKMTVRGIYQEAALEDDDQQRRGLVKHGMRSEADHRVTSMISLAQSEPEIPVKLIDLDKNGWLFNVANGTIDLRTGELLPHNRKDLLTIMVPIEYQPEATSLLWLKFLDRVTDGNTELQTYLQRAVGYSLTADTKAQVVFFLYGLGNNGKSTFLTTVRKLMGEYGARANSDLFMLKDKNTGGPKEALANLRGKRFVAASELEDGRRLAVGVIKDTTGGETIKADRKYEHEEEFPPTHKLWLTGNHKPVIPDTTLSIWRRVKLIPFTVTIPPEETDLELPQKLEAELPGILAWAVKGCLDWQRYSLSEPRIVTDATAAYRHEQDILGDFIEDCCIIEPMALVPKSELKESYLKWCQDNSMEPVSQHTFRNSIVEKGITDHKGTAGKRFWRGIHIKDSGNSGKVAE